MFLEARKIQTRSFYFVVLCFWFVGHTQRCSEHTPGSLLKESFLMGWETRGDIGDLTRVSREQKKKK